MLRISPHIEVRSTVFTEIDSILQYLIRTFSHNTHIRRTHGSILWRFVSGICYTLHLTLTILKHIKHLGICLIIVDIDYIGVVVFPLISRRGIRSEQHC